MQPEENPFEQIKRVDSLQQSYTYDIERDVIGSGAFSTVFRATHRSSGKAVALKVLSKKRMDTDKSIKDVAREVRILQAVSHESMCRLVEALQTDEEVGIAMTLVDGSMDLGSYLKKAQKLSEMQAALITIQVLRAVEHLHDKKCIIHRDLKPENIMLSDMEILMKELVTPSSRHNNNGHGGEGKKVHDCHGHSTAMLANAADEQGKEQQEYSESLNMSWAKVTLVDFGFSRYISCGSVEAEFSPLLSEVRPNSATKSMDPSPQVHQSSPSPTPGTSSRLQKSPTEQGNSVTELFPSPSHHHGNDSITSAFLASSPNVPQQQQAVALSGGAGEIASLKATLPLSVPCSPAITFSPSPQHSSIGNNNSDRHHHHHSSALLGEDDDVLALPVSVVTEQAVTQHNSDNSIRDSRQQQQRNSEIAYSRERSVLTNASTVSTSSVFLSPCGSDRYLPLEMIQWLVQQGGQKMKTTPEKARKLDAYSIGVVVYVMLSGCFPYNAKSRATLATQLANFPPKMNSIAWTGVSDLAKEFVRGLLKQDVEERLTVSQALQHPWIQEALQKLPPPLRHHYSKSSAAEGSDGYHSSTAGERVPTPKSDGSTSSTSGHNSGHNSPELTVSPKKPKEDEQQQQQQQQQKLVQGSAKSSQY